MSKKIVISCVSIILMVIIAFIYFAIYKEDSELQETKTKEAQLDSIMQIREQWREQQMQEKTFHWNVAESNEIGQVIFEKIAEAGIQKTECFGNGRLVSINGVRCRKKDDAKITCSYTPRIVFATCDNKPVTYLEKTERFKSSPQSDSVAAKKDLANKLREADFSDLVSEIKGLR